MGQRGKYHSCADRFGSLYVPSLRYWIAPAIEERSAEGGGSSLPCSVALLSTAGGRGYSETESGAFWRGAAGGLILARKGIGVFYIRSRGINLGIFLPGRWRGEAVAGSLRTRAWPRQR